MRALKTGFLLTALTLILVLGGEAMAGRQGMTFGLVIAVLMNGGAYFFSDKIALASSGAQPGDARAGAAALRRDGATGGQGQSADAQALRNSAGGAQCLRHRAETPRTPP